MDEASFRIPEDFERRSKQQTITSLAGWRSHPSARWPWRRGPIAGQVALEYGVLIAVVVAALLAMQIYMKRSISGGLRQAVDSIGEQYDPRHTTSDLTFRIRSDATTTSELLTNQMVDVGVIADVMATTTRINAPGDVTQRTGWERVEALGTNLWN